MKYVATLLFMIISISASVLAQSESTKTTGVIVDKMTISRGNFGLLKAFDAASIHRDSILFIYRVGIKGGLTAESVPTRQVLNIGDSIDIIGFDKKVNLTDALPELSLAQKMH